MIRAMSRIAPRVDLKVGFACNNRCVFCAQGEKREACGAVPVPELIDRLASARKESDALVLTGGEPTLYKSLLPLVHAARRLGFTSIQIQTNGRMLSYLPVLSALARAGATEFAPSLHGSTAEIHDGLTRAPGSFDESRQGIRNVVHAGLPVVTNSVITRSNVHDLPELTRLLASLGVRQAQLAFVHPVGTAHELFDEVVPRLPEVVPPLSLAAKIARDAGMRLVTEAIPFCFLRGMEELAVEDAIPKTTVLDFDGQVLDYSEWRVAEGKAHGPPCHECTRKHACEGPWREYPAKHGWAEFVPIA